MQQLEPIVALLRKHGLKITPQRIAIVNYVLRADTHPSAEEIHKVIKKKYPMVSLATIYKTLDLLQKMSLIQELGFANGSARYDLNVGRHINVVCMQCGRIDDINDEQQSLSEIESKVAEKSKYKIFSRRFELYGYCNDCNSRISTTTMGSV